MAKVIILSGDIGLDITAIDIAQELKAANGGDIDFQINSRGGLVFAGIEIYNLIRNYSGKTRMIVTGIAASMGTYVALAADEVIAYSNTSWMVHNALALILGNHNDMRKRADSLEGMSNILAKAYANKTGKPLAEMKALMDDETYMFGDEIFKSGFVDEIFDADEKDDHDRASAMATSLASIEACMARLRDTDAANADMDRAVAYMDGMAALIDPPAPPKIETPAAASGDDDPAGAGKKKQEDKDMTFEEYLAANPAAQATYDAAIAKARGEGIAEVRASIKATMEKVSPILSSDAYDKTTKELGVAAITGEKSIEAFEAVVAVVDRENEKAKEAAAQADVDAGGDGQGGKETPPHGAGGEAAAQAEYDAKKARLNVGEV